MTSSVNPHKLITPEFEELVTDELRFEKDVADQQKEERNTNARRELPSYDRFEVLYQDTDLWLMCLKKMKGNLELQFIDAKMSIAIHREQLDSYEITQEEFNKIMVDHTSWRIKAARFLRSIEEKLAEVYHVQKRERAKERI